MIKTVSLWVGSLLVSAFPYHTNDPVRMDIAQHMRKMIGFKNQKIATSFSEDYLRATPKKFCRMLLNDFRHELMIELASGGITLEALDAMHAMHKQKILQEDNKRRLSPTEKAGHPRIKKVVHELSDQLKIEHPIRVINFHGDSCIGSARINELFFDEEWWENEFDKNQDVLRFTVGHELSHIRYEDIACEEALNALHKKIANKRVARRVKESIKRMNKFTEVQADINSALASKRALKGYERWTAQDIAGCGDTGGLHPLMSQRLQLAGLLGQLNNLYQPQSRKKRRLQ